MKKATPKTTPKSNVEKKSTSEKKLIQARLPFKVLSTTSSTETTTTTAAAASSSSTHESRKRKLSYSPEEIISAPKHTKKLIISSQLKENLDSKDSGSSVVISDDESPLSDNNEGGDNDEFNTSGSPQIKSLNSNKKLKIKLPLGSVNKKRKKSKSIIRSKLEEGESSSDPEIVIEEINRLKKTKIDEIISSSSVISAVSTTIISSDVTEPEIKSQKEILKVEELKNVIKKYDKDKNLKVLNTTPPSLKNKNKRGKLELGKQKRNEEKEQKEELKRKDKEELTSEEKDKKEKKLLDEQKSQKEISKDEEIKNDDIKATDKDENESLNTSSTEIKSNSNETITEETSLNDKKENKTNNLQKEEIILVILSEDEKEDIEHNKNESKSISSKNNEFQKTKTLQSSISLKPENKSISKTMATTSKISSSSPNRKNLTPPSLKKKKENTKQELEKQKRKEIDEQKCEEKEQKEELKRAEKEELTSKKKDEKEKKPLGEQKSQKEISKDEELKNDDIKATDKDENETLNTSSTEIKNNSNETITEETSLNDKKENKTNNLQKEEIILVILSEDEKEDIEHNKNESKSISSKNNEFEKTKTLQSSISLKPENKSISKTMATTSKISSSSSNRKNLTPPSLKKKKENPKQELEKQKRKEIEEQKRKEKEEREELKRKEKQEKEELKRKEKEEKEKKRLAELEVKNEEKRQREDDKRKKDEQKEEERKKRDDEKRKKEEAENKEKKAAAAFTNYFRSKKTGSSKINVVEDQNSHCSPCNQLEHCAFMPFQVKADMKLAPLIRNTLNSVSKKNLDGIINDDKCRDLPEEELYLKVLQTGKYVANKLNKMQVEGSDVVIVEDELLGVGQSITEASKSEQMYKAKYLNFHENRRPPYYGTWRKKSQIIGPRKPFSHDKIYFDYDVESDDEWEEEEPGESLHGSDDEKESEDEYEVDNEFFVPHGHLSDEELQDEDNTEQDNSPECQKAKLKILQVEFAKQMKKKTEKIKPRVIGIVWVDENGNKPDNCSNAIWESLNKCAIILCGDSPLTFEQPVNKNMEAGPPILQVNKKSSSKRNELTEELIVDLIRLVHGNRHKRTFLIDEFQAFIAEKFKTNQPENPSIEYSKAVIKEKINKISRWSILEDQESKNKKKKLCWIVSSDILNMYNLHDISSLNTWNYILPPANWLITNSVDKSQHTKNNTNEKKIIEQKNNKTKGSLSDIKVCTQIKSDVIKCEENVINQSSNTISDGVIKYSSDESAKVFQKSNTNENLSCSENVIVKDTPIKPGVIKKRVPLLMSVPIGETIPETFKNEIISNFLKKSKDKSETATTSTTTNLSETIKNPFSVNPDSFETID